ncbi:hypothetical protein LTR84_006141 [Exophiala bonariae]|uniref:AAA+ ATPase domain-containing protein n=1 Tax=Exophiala bonariae TaxID=1690606 RepID=A0AAV9N564_9EURO|nr:hypothetical protein LTR84_006141 [Exophiala bonariae]
MENFISAQDRQCRLAFDKILEISPKNLKIQDDYDRYKIWAANTGASHTGQTYKKSLDYRLREAQQYRDKVVDVLKQLHQFLVDAESYVSGKVEDDLSSSSDEASGDDGLTTHENVKWTLSDSEEDGDTTSAKDGDCCDSALPQVMATGLEWLASDSRLESTLASIEMAITYLYRIPVREPANYNRLKRYERTDDGEFNMYSYFDQRFVHDAFPNAKDSITSRLGKLVTNRRRILRYRQLYNDDLQREAVQSGEASHLQRQIHHASDLSPNDPTVPESDNHTQKQPRSLPKSSLKASTFRPIDSKPLDTDHLLSSAISEADEASSIAPTVVEEHLVLPARPKDRQGQELSDFVCPYCGVFKHLRSDRAWRKHLMRDLAPYVCTYEKCTEPDQMFDNRDDWFSHESQHYSAYFCGIPTHPNYNSLASFRDHMSSVHSTSFSHDGDTSKTEIFLRRVPRLDEQCNLCGRPTNHLKHHIGRHLERIALFALPRNHAPDGAGAEQLGDSSASVGNFQGSERRSSQTDSLLRVISEASSAKALNSNSSNSDLRGMTTTPLDGFMDNIALPEGVEGKLPMAYLERMMVHIPGVIPGGDIEKLPIDVNRTERLNTTDVYYVVFLEMRRASTWPKPDAVFDLKYLLHTYYRFTTKSIQNRIPLYTEGEMTGEAAVNHQVSCFIDMVKTTLQFENVNDTVLQWLEQLAGVWNQYRHDSYQLEVENVPEVAQDEDWSAIKPELSQKQRDLVIYDVRNRSVKDALIILPTGRELKTYTVGLTDYLARIAGILDPPSGVPGVLIWGPPGVGKTHLAMEYIRQYNSKYPGGIFWIDCSTAETTVNGFDSIFKATDVANVQDSSLALERLLMWFSRRGKWLVVFDNMNHSFSTGTGRLHYFRRMILRQAIGCTMLTTRDENFFKNIMTEEFRIPKMRIDGMSKEHSLQLIFSVPGAKNLPTQEQRAGALTIHERTDGLPLFLHHVISVLQNKKMPLDAPGLWPWLGDRLTPLFRTISQGLSENSISLLRVWSYWHPGTAMRVVKLYNLYLKELNFKISRDSIEQLCRNGLLMASSSLVHFDSTRALQMPKGIQQIVLGVTKEEDARRAMLSQRPLEIPWIIRSSQMVSQFFSFPVSLSTEITQDLVAYAHNARSLLDHYRHHASARPDFDREIKQLERMLLDVESERKSRERGQEDDHRLGIDIPSSVSGDKDRKVEIPQGSLVNFHRDPDDPFVQQGDPIPELARRFSDDIDAKQSPLVRPRRYSHDLSSHQRAPDNHHTLLQEIPLPMPVQRFDQEAAQISDTDSYIQEYSYIEESSRSPNRRSSVLMPAQFHGWEAEKTSDTDSDIQASPTSSYERSSALKAIFQGTQNKTTTTRSPPRMAQVTGDGSSKRPRQRESAARSSILSSEVSLPTVALDRSVSNTIAQGEILRSENEPAFTGPGVAYSALRHTLRTQTQRKGEQPARRASSRGSVSS